MTVLSLSSRVLKCATTVSEWLPEAAGKEVSSLERCPSLGSSHGGVGKQRTKLGSGPWRRTLSSIG